MARWIASLLGSPANLTQWPEAEKAPTTTAGSGPQSRTAFALFDRGSLCWRTYPGFDLLGACPPYSQTWPRSGSASNGTASELPTWVPVTSGNECSSWPTARSTDGAKGGPNQRGSSGDMMLPSAAAKWATPRANDSEKRGHVASRENPELVSMAQNWPTPSASVANDGETPETWHARSAQLKVKHGNGNGVGMPLTIAASSWPTPASRDAKGENSSQHMNRTDGRTDGRSKNHADQLPNFVSHVFYSHQDPTMSDGLKSSESNPGSPRRRLNPNFAEWLMGWPVDWSAAEPTACDALAMESLRFRLDSQLSRLLAGSGYEPDMALSVEQGGIHG